MKSLSWRHLIAVGLLMAASTIAYTANGTHEALRVELLKMAADDQDVRQVTEKVDFRRWKAVDVANRARMKEIVSNFGWPTYEMVGKDGANAAWLLVQHADSDKDFQLKVLELMKPLVEQNQASGADFAYLYDRTHYPQRFGTQGDCVSKNEWQPFEIEDIVNVDERRRAVGLSLLADYAKLFKDVCPNAYTVLQNSSELKRTVAIPGPVRKTAQ
jgi:hypothetical protein